MSFQRRRTEPEEVAVRALVLFNFGVAAVGDLHVRPQQLPFRRREGAHGAGEHFVFHAAVRAHCVRVGRDERAVAAAEQSLRTGQRDHAHLLDARIVAGTTC